jgi:dCMP deaminase
MKITKWDLRFLELAKHISEWSKDPSTKVGAVIADNKNIIVSVGFNGFPKGIADDDRLFEREIKYKKIVHAEVNAILHAKKDLSNCTLYTYPFMPCSQCANLIVQSGIKKILAPIYINERWEKDFNISIETFQEAGVKLVLC